ncbi:MULTISPECIES: asparaginase [Enterococcus]|uniref:asparaginase n=1 Tax=Enterococcus sulfureus ATCC 49903 TaxID=1140003 RepID=S0NZX8_9ENTE|nr:asparaginase [Enterococcus sulfureus]EOT47230.1 L-asparaginase [Enterococcus sulfureus ATCC 49903]EOT83475.1 L-asparaginase [Enterococcus sulfureus ATCC 49903]
MKQILVLHTGGTIAMKEDATGVSPDAINPLLTTTLSIPESITLTVEDFLNVPSPHMTFIEMIALKQRIQQAKAEGFDSIVVTHGTDTLEETAYFLDTTIGDLLPIILTGAMRSSNEIGSDGLYNFANALRVAESDESIGKGVLVVLNDEIHTARYVTKTHTTNVATFRTPTLGPIGIITKHRILFMLESLDTIRYDVNQMQGLVPIVKAYAGMTGDFFHILNQTKIDGIVIEALGAGNLPPATLPEIQKLLDKDIPIVLVSRCFNGVAEPVYGYPGGGKELEKMGIIFCNTVNSQKARIKLLIGKNAQLSETDFRQFIQK